MSDAKENKAYKEKDMDKTIDWSDFQKWFFELEEGSTGQDKRYFLNLAGKCGNMKMDDDLLAWYDDGNYRKES